MPASSARQSASNRPSAKPLVPFLGIVEAVTVEPHGQFAFDGAIARDHLGAVWTWIVRDLAADLIDVNAIDDSERSRMAIEALLPDLIARAEKAIADARAHSELGRRLTAQLGGDDVYDRLPVALNALRFHEGFGRAAELARNINAAPDEAGVAVILQSAPYAEQPGGAFLMQAVLGGVVAPHRMVGAAIRIANAATEPAMLRSGFGSMIEAMLAHAQNQTPVLSQAGTFGDVDLICRALDRFHRLMRAVTGYIELNRNSRWAKIAGALTTEISARLEPKLRDVAPDLNKSLRRRDGTDRLDSDQILSALNGMYLLSAVRDCRETLALNTLFDQVWTQTGQALEIHTDRLMEQLRQNPADTIASARLDAALKMGELRFGQSYAEGMRHAKQTAERRLNSA
jgi:hypothetical protein